jgi:outer membrane immunogenic protein
MRWWICGLLIAIAWPALAADYDDSWLRGSQTIGPAVGPPPRLYRIWAGAYGGVQVGEDFHGVDFSSAVNNPLSAVENQDGILRGLAAALPGIPELHDTNNKSPSYGGFVGYNWQIDDVVFGAELNANRSSLHAAQSGSVTRSFIVTSGGNVYAPTTVTVTNNATADLSTYGTVRGRLGWTFGNFLPYLVGGISFSQIDSSRFVDVNYFAVCLPQPPTPCPNAAANYPFTDTTHGKYIIGFDGALGLDYLLTKNVFIRGEVEYVQLGAPNDIRMNTVSARTAIGLKF